MVVYLDMLLLLNFVANYFLLLGAGRLTGTGLCRWRIILGGVAGAIYSALLLVANAAWLMQWPCKILVGVVMVLISYGGEKRLLKITLFFFASSAALAGLIYAAELLGAKDLIVENGLLYSSLNFRLLLLIFVICYFFVSLFFRKIGRHDSKELVELKVEAVQKQVVLTALLDSGHTLTDPISNRPVIVAEYFLFRDSLPSDVDPAQPIDGLKRCRARGIENVRLIPYRAVGVDCGLLLALKANAVMIGDENLGSLLIALSPTSVSDNGEYQALIGGV